MTSPWHSWLQGIKKLKNQPMVGFNGRTDGLQFNVGFGGLQDKVLPFVHLQCNCAGSVKLCCVQAATLHTCGCVCNTM